MSSISSWLSAPPNNFSTTLSSGVTNNALTIPLNSVTSLPTEGVGVIFKKDADGAVDATTVEFIHWTNVSGLSLTLADTGDRGIDGSYGAAAQAHDANDYFEVWVSSQYYSSQRAGFVAEHSVAGVHDTTKVAMLAGTQTITGQKSFDLQIPLKGIAAPASPSSGYVSLYAGTDDKIYKKTSAGVVSELGAGGSESETFIIPGTLATGTDLAKTWVLPFDCKLQSATPYVKTAGTTNATTFDINLAGSTIATTKLSIASGATSGSNQALDDPTTTRTAGSLITIDVDSVSTTAPVEAYIVLFYERV